MSWEKQPGFCPSCKAVIAPDSKDCPACGCVFEKWNAKQAREAIGERQAQETRAQAQAQPVYAAAPPPAPEKSSLLKRLSGAGAAASAAALLFWLYSPGKPGPAPEKAQDAGKTGFSYAVPDGWTVASRDEQCRDAGCVIALLRLEGPAGRVNPSITVQLLDRKPEELSAAAFKDQLLAGLKGGYDAAEAGDAGEVVVDGLPSMRLEASGAKHLRLQVAAEVATNVDAYFRDQMAKYPTKSVHTVMAQTSFDRRNPNPVVVTQQAQYAEVDVRKVDGMVLVPLSGNVLRVSYEYDVADEATARHALDGFLGALRVRDRSRPVDRLGSMKPPAQIGAAGLVFAAVFLLLT